MLVKNSMVFLVMAIFLSLKTSPITVYPKQKSANENSEFIKNVQQDEYIQTSESSAVSANDTASPNTNFVNYDLDKRNMNFESFDEMSYEKRDSIPGSSSTKSSNSIATMSVNEDLLEQVENGKRSPYLPTAKILMTYKNVYNKESHKYDTLYYVGTAFLEGPNLAVSAGHCMFHDVTKSGGYQDNRKNPRFPDKVEFFFGCSNQDDYSSNSDCPYYAKGKTLSIEYDYYLNQSWSHDWSVIVLDRSIGNQIGWYGKISNFNTIGSSIYGWGVSL